MASSLMNLQNHLSAPNDFIQLAKGADVGNEVIFTTQEADVDKNLRNFYPHNFITIISLDVGSNPVVPSAGEYVVTAELVEDGGFLELTDNGTIPAAETGGTAAPDGTNVRASFTGCPWRIKVTPSAVAGAVNYRVIVQQRRD